MYVNSLTNLIKIYQIPSYEIKRDDKEMLIDFKHDYNGSDYFLSELDRTITINTYNFYQLSNYDYFTTINELTLFICNLMNIYKVYNSFSIDLGTIINSFLHNTILKKEFFSYLFNHLSETVNITSIKFVKDGLNDDTIKNLIISDKLVKEL